MREVDDWTLKNMLSDFYQDFRALDAKRAHLDEKENLIDHYVHLVKLAFERKEFGDLMTVENFERCCQEGSFINYDGHGYYLDYDGNKLGYVDCRDTSEDWPDKAAFVAWYNK